jgi:Peptidase propeptide and YPEB domain
MSPILKRCLYGLALLVLLAPLALRAAVIEPCSSLPRSAWISWLEIESMLRDRGFRLVELRITDQRCYAVVGLDARGDRYSFQMHPVTGEVMSKSAQGEARPGVPWRFGKKVD